MAMAVVMLLLANSIVTSASYLPGGGSKCRTGSAWNIRENWRHYEQFK
jgi:hypothetical protein